MGVNFIHTIQSNLDNVKNYVNYYEAQNKVYPDVELDSLSDNNTANLVTAFL